MLEKYGDADIFWGQEEPQNMGSWDFMEPKLRKLLDNKKPVLLSGTKAHGCNGYGYSVGAFGRTARDRGDGFGFFLREARTCLLM